MKFKFAFMVSAAFVSVISLAPTKSFAQIPTSVLRPTRVSGVVVDTAALTAADPIQVFTPDLARVPIRRESNPYKTHDRRMSKIPIPFALVGATAGAIYMGTKYGMKSDPLFRPFAVFLFGSMGMGGGGAAGIVVDEILFRNDAH